MEDIVSLWTFEESIAELKKKLQYMTYELEVTKEEANEEMRKNNENIKELLHLLQTTCKERDEAKAQLMKLQQILSFNKPTFDQLIPGPFSPDSPLLTHYPTRENSGITESNSFYVETCNNNNNKNPQIQPKTQSHVTSPAVDSLFYPPAVSSPDSSRNNLVIPTTTIMSAPTQVVDQGNLIIENMAKGRPLPHKGRLLQAVIVAGPLLQTLMVAGSLPRWRNPPGSLTHQIPPVNIIGCDSAVAHKNGSDATYLVKGLGNSSSYGHISDGSLGIYPSPKLDFGSGSSGSCLMGGRLIPSDVNLVGQILKRQKLL